MTTQTHKCTCGVRDTETIDKLYLELSHFTQARTSKELERDKQIGEIRSMAMGLCGSIANGVKRDRLIELAEQIEEALNELLP